MKERARVFTNPAGISTTPMMNVVSRHYVQNETLRFSATPPSTYVTVRKDLRRPWYMI